MEEVYNVFFMGIACFLLGLVYYSVREMKKKGLQITLIAILSFIIGMIVHSAMGHTWGEWLREHLHFHEKDEKKEK